MDKLCPIDLSPIFNAKRTNEPRLPSAPPPWQEETLQALQNLPSGQQNFWGVPFALGGVEEGQPCWILLESPERPITVSLWGKATFIILAHFCDVSAQPEGTIFPLGTVLQPGEHLADYVLVYADGSEHRLPIRRRFEINSAVVTYGQRAFAARPHAAPYPVDWRGPYEGEGWGRSQTGVNWPLPDLSQGQYWLYALPNPTPDKELKALRLEPTGADTLAVAAITLYYGRDHPLRHHRLEALRVTLPNGKLLEEVQVSVDLGVIARSYAVPAFEPGSWLESPVKGWGGEARPREPAHEVIVEVSASPDATLTVADREVPMRDLYERGRALSSDGQARVEVLSPQKSWVHVSIEDASTGKITPARVHFRTDKGRYLPPYGHRHQVNDNWFEDYGGDLKLGNTEYAYVDGRFQIELPVGQVYVEVVKGFEYRPLRQELKIEPGQRQARLQIERPINLRTEGWVSADTHVHFISPQTAWLEAQAEGLNLVNLLASQWGDLFTNVADITGDLSGTSRDDTLVWVGTENRQHLLGHISLLGVRGEAVYPMCASGPTESYLGDPTWMGLAEWADRCREREGVVVIPHFPNPYCEVVADIILGKVDGIELRDYQLPTLDTFATREWYRFLNCGYRVAAVGGTDKMSAGMPVGGVRTYAHLGDEEFTFAAWAKAVRAGRTFTTSGPLIGLSVEGHSPGDEIRLPAGGGCLEIHAWASSVQPFHTLQVVANGEVIASEMAPGGTTRLDLKTRLHLAGSGWIAARCMSQHKAWHVWPVHLAAHTSPVYVVVGEQELFSPSDATYMLTLLDGGLTWLDTLSIPADPQRQRQIRRIFEEAQRRLHARLHAQGQGHGTHGQ